MLERPGRHGSLGLVGPAPMPTETAKRMRPIARGPQTEKRTGGRRGRFRGRGWVVGTLNHRPWLRRRTSPDRNNQRPREGTERGRSLDARARSKGAECSAPHSSPRLRPRRWFRFAVACGVLEESFCRSEEFPDQVGHDLTKSVLQLAAGVGLRVVEGEEELAPQATAKRNPRPGNAHARRAVPAGKGKSAADGRRSLSILHNRAARK